VHVRKQPEPHGSSVGAVPGDRAGRPVLAAHRPATRAERAPAAAPRAGRSMRRGGPP
jgi:hypothetical protein